MPVKVNKARVDPFRVIERKAEQFTEAAVGVIATNAMMLTPREYGTLANSQYTSVKKKWTKITGIVGYGADYAKYLNGLPGYNKPKWKPRPVGEKKGPSTNMNAEPEFLTKGGEGPNTASTLRTLEGIFKV